MPRHDTGYQDYLHFLASDKNCQHSPGLRNATEAFIRQCYAQAYAADVQHFMPVLLSLCDQQGDYQAALGLRPAAHEPLFLEHYLDKPIEQAIAKQFRVPVCRDDIVEVGNLALRERDAIRSLIIAMTAFLCAADIQWVAFTIGKSLSNSFTRLGLPLTDLGPARLESLPERNRASWGSYYDQKPHVMAGRLSDAHDFLLNYCFKEQALKFIWEQAQRKAMVSV